jgi:hypothetical protein
MAGKKRDPFTRFLKKVNIKGPNECWLFKETKNRYPIFWNGKKRQNANRFIYEYINDITLTSDQFICHTCDTPRCCNPKHLWLGDAKSNADDRDQKGRRIGPPVNVNGVYALP